MSEPSPARPARSDLPVPLAEALRTLEGRYAPDELAARVARAALSFPGVAGVRLWRMDRGKAEVWATAGTPPRSAAPVETQQDAALWTGALGTDDYRMRVLEVRGAGPIGRETRAWLEWLARFAALALALAERRSAMEELSSIIEATKRLNSTLDLGELIHIILQIATRQTRAERGTVFLVDRERGEIWSLVGLGLEQQEIRLPIDRGIAGWAAREGTAVRLEDAYADPRFEPEIDRRLGFVTRRLLCLPIRNEHGAIIGVLQLLNKLEPFDNEDEAFLDALSAHVALALEKAQLYRERLAKQRLERDLELAREIQAGLLPEAPPRWRGLDIAVSHRASQMVGGDYYDFVPVGEGTLLTVVADVEGKGAASALVMASVQATLRALADHLGSLEDLAATINHRLLDGTRASKYLSMFLALVETGGRRLRYLNAGHVPPAVVRADGSCEFLTEGGLVVGLLPQVSYSSGEVRLGAGDVLVACTDGITEATDAAGHEYGRVRLAETVKRHRAQSAAEIVRSVLEEVEAYSRRGAHEDDRVLLVMKAT
jgi:sigma-B regulation protein RsbU (phosphoserine phosphatase)